MLSNANRPVPPPLLVSAPSPLLIADMMPLVLLAGFLGAGKTRLLSQLIPALHARGTRSRVILNDFENATIDAARLGELEALVTPLNGECVCAAVRCVSCWIRSMPCLPRLTTSGP